LEEEFEALKEMNGRRQFSAEVEAEIAKQINRLTAFYKILGDIPWGGSNAAKIGLLNVIERKQAKLRNSIG
jgi:hypothetical protein